MKKQLVVDIIDSIAVSKNSAEVPMDNKRINDKQKMVFVFFFYQLININYRHQYNQYCS